jgi:DNA-binding LytR/AlgR family response regulator
MNLQGHTPARAVIADDERLMRDQLRARLAQVWPSLEIVAEAKNGLEAIEAVRVHQPDVIFLDIRMPGLTGVEAAKQIAQLEVGDDALLPEMVFITAYDQYALDAFEQGAVGEAADSELTASRGGHAVGGPSVQQLLHVLSAQLNGQPVQYLSWLQASVGQSIHMVAVSDVLFCISDDKYTRVQTLKQEFLIRKPIKELVDELDPKVFWQIHRSTLVNVSAIAGVQRDERGRQEVLIKGRPESLAVSRSASSLFKGM